MRPYGPPMSESPEPSASPGLLLLAAGGVVIGVVLIAAFCLLGNAWLVPAGLGAIVIMTVALAGALSHLIDTDRVTPGPPR